MVTKRVMGATIAAFALLWAASGAFASSSTAGLAYESGGAKGPAQIWVANGDGSNPRKLTTGGAPSLAPNGGAVAVVSESGRSAVVIYSATGNVIGKFFNARKVAAGQLEWSRDSRYLAVGLSDTTQVTKIGTSGLAVIDTKTGKTTMIASGVVSGISWSPTSDSLVYALATTASFNAPTNLDEYRSTSSSSSTMPLTSDGRSVEPVWGKRGIVYAHVSLRGRQQAPMYQLFLLNRGHSTQITHMRIGSLVDGLVPVAVSADGTHLAAEFVGTDTSAGYSVNLATHTVKQLIVKGQEVSAWGISRDGKRILVDFGGFENPPQDGTLETVPFSGGSPTVLEAHADFGSWDQ
jgi:Tol biopolymer transport system component